MTCRQCGYMMTAFDKECPRCKGTADKSNRNPYVTHQETKLRERENNLPQPRILPPEPEPQSVQPLPEARPSPRITPDMLACPVCGNLSVQNVPAIVQAGTWTQNTQGRVAGAAMDGSGHMMPMGGSTQSTSHGATHLAQMLLPPPRPRFHSSYVTAWLTFWGGLVGVILISNVSEFGGVVALVIALCIVGAALSYDISRNGDAKEKHSTRVVRWSAAMDVWSRTFFCPRCNHVYDPVAQRIAMADNLMSLL